MRKSMNNCEFKFNFAMPTKSTAGYSMVIEECYMTTYQLTILLKITLSVYVNFQGYTFINIKLTRHILMGFSSKFNTSMFSSKINSHTEHTSCLLNLAQWTILQHLHPKQSKPHRGIFSPNTTGSPCLIGDHELQFKPLL